MLLDRLVGVGFGSALLAGVLGGAAWAWSRRDVHPLLPPAGLLLAVAALGAARHHFTRNWLADDDINRFAPADPRPVEVRGQLDDEPAYMPAVHGPLLVRDQESYAATVLRVTHWKQRGEWEEITGRVRLMMPGTVTGVHVGDTVEVVGRLSLLHGPANPGEPEPAAYLRDQGVRAQITASRSASGVVRLDDTSWGSWRGWMARMRGRGQEILRQALPPQTASVAAALILGDGALDQTEWELYVRTGVLAVLAISGQHLVILAGFLWIGLRLAGMRQRPGAVLVALLLFGYALLTGGRAPAVRSAIMVAAAAGAIFLYRRSHPAGLLALAWLILGVIDPSDLFTPGCQLSFLAVAVLAWLPKPLLSSSRDPLEEALAEAQPIWQQMLRTGLWYVGEAFLVTAVLWLALAPLVAIRFHFVSPAGIVLGPPLTLLTSFALLIGFVLLLAAPWCAPLAALCAAAVNALLAACSWLIRTVDRWPGSWAHTGGPGPWLVALFYLILLAFLVRRATHARLYQVAFGGAAWLVLVLLLPLLRPPGDELRCTFLAMGHGGCAVLETPDGRTLLYDAGATRGPDAARQLIAPFLWERGIRRIDEVFLSHADIDHFNDLVPLLDRFPVGQVNLTPTFADKQTQAVRETLRVLKERRLPVRVVKAGDRFTCGEVELEVLHPPDRELPGKADENARSMVLHVKHRAHSILLTGDLLGPGLARVLQLPPRSVDILMAPHHGSLRLDTKGLAEWAMPEVVVACAGPPVGAPPDRTGYEAVRATYLSTQVHGAVTVRCHATGITVETFRTQRLLALRGRPARNQEFADRDRDE
jgi:competence protein ComEC